MKIKLFFISCLALLTYATSGGQNTPSFSLNMESEIKENCTVNEKGAIQIGHCLNTITASLSTNITDDLQVGVLLTKDDLKNYAGNRITKLWIGLGNNKITSPKIFLSNSVGGEAFFEQDITLTPNQWNEITLLTPYTILENEELFINYQASVRNDFPVGLDAGPIRSGNSYIYLGDKWTTISSLWGIDANICITAVVEGNIENLPQNDIKLWNTNIPEYIKTNQAFEIKCKLQNKAYMNLNSFDVTYKIGNGEAITQTIDNIDIPNYGSYDFTLTAFAEKPGNHTLEISLSNPNKNIDEDLAYNEFDITGFFYNTHIQRKILLEHFTISTSCNECEEVNNMWDRIISEKNNIIRANHYALKGLTDEYTHNDSRLDYAYFRGQNAETLFDPPLSMLDRTKMNKYGAATHKGGTAFAALDENFLSSLSDVRLAVPAYAIINIENVYDKDNREADITVTANKIPGFPLGDNVMLHLYLIENDIKGSNNYTHNYVIRHINRRFGDNMSFNPEGNAERKYLISIPEAWTAENIEIIAYLSNGALGEVFNAESIHLIEKEVSINNENYIDDLTVYSFNSSIYIQGEYISATIYDMMGRLVKQLDNKQTSYQTDNGIYLVRVETKTGTSVHKVILSK